MKTEPKADVYARVTDEIIADLEQGVRPWAKPWSGGNTDCCCGAKRWKKAISQTAG
jgi:antirestriction protein ArdC